MIGKLLFNNRYDDNMYGVWNYQSTWACSCFAWSSYRSSIDYSCLTSSTLSSSLHFFQFSLCDFFCAFIFIFVWASMQRGYDDMHFRQQVLCWLDSYNIWFQFYSLRALDQHFVYSCLSSKRSIWKWCCPCLVLLSFAAVSRKLSKHFPSIFQQQSWADFLIKPLAKCPSEQFVIW